MPECLQEKYIYKTNLKCTHNFDFFLLAYLYIISLREKYTCQEF